MKSPLFERDDVQRWLRLFLERRLGIEGAVEVGYPEAGNKTPIAIVDDGAGRRVVVRLVADVTRFVKLVAIQRRLGAWDLPVPRLLSTSLASIVGPAGHAVIVETAVPGKPWLDGSPEEREAALGPIAATLARFHAVGGQEAKSWWLRRHRSADGARSRASANLGRLAGHVSPSTGDELAAGLARATDRARSVPADTLIHGRVNNNNYLIDADRVHVVDLEGVCRGHVAQDLVPAVHRLGRWAPHHADLVIEAYGRAIDVDVAAVAATWPLYEARLFLARAAGLVRDVERGDVGAEEGAALVSESVERARASLAGEAPVPWCDESHARA